ncbi:hypothetical protein H1V43_13885 [Streptomyces sp. PSKA54]|uniref:Uncharacterized protein n=1 Tax=Streptomyces himalayensis subsp. aureolus TaxID=2758039 RepID=A0A7W2D0I7_9ACTN|nr:hypothetical protein [Streptomyces himalayensis]MBA4862464.1 hypothetical protein [Streptomyces himalayensis subsp. aureolus]
MTSRQPSPSRADVAAIMRAAPLAAALCTPPQREVHGVQAAAPATARTAPPSHHGEQDTDTPPGTVSSPG